MGTVRGVHRNKGGVVWLEYLGSTTLYEVERHLLFPTPKAAQEHLTRVRKGKRTPPPRLWANLTRRLTCRLAPRRTL